MNLSASIRNMAVRVRKNRISTILKVLCSILLLCFTSSLPAVSNSLSGSALTQDAVIRTTLTTPTNVRAQKINNIIMLHTDPMVNDDHPDFSIEIVVDLPVNSYVTLRLEYNNGSKQ